MKQLDKRLRLVADMIPVGAVVGDIGTDHAYLPVHLIKEGKISSAIAADLREGPLTHAKATVEEAGLSECVETRLSDGLDNFAPHEINCIVMAGMGGILITQLLERAKWLKDSAITLVLQPMTDAPLLRNFLAQQGFRLVAERATADKKHAYTVMKAVYAGEPHALTPLQALVGLLDTPMGRCERLFLQKEATALQKRICGLRSVNASEQEMAASIFLWNDLEKIILGRSL